LANGLACYGARIDDDRIIESRRARVTAHDLGLIRVEPAAKRYHFGFGHERDRLLSERRPHNSRAGLDRHFRQFGKIDCALVFELDGARHQNVVVGCPLDTENAARQSDFDLAVGQSLSSRTNRRRARR
jgi:hypothetical protein